MDEYPEPAWKRRWRAWREQRRKDSEDAAEVTSAWREALWNNGASTRWRDTDEDED